MLNKVEVRNSQGELLTFQLEDVSDGFVVEDIGGLDPVKATLVSTSFAQLNGTQYQSSKRENRNITFKIGLEPDYFTTSVADLRQRLYDYFMPQTSVDLRFFDSKPLEVDISGRVESCQNSIFTKEPAVDISIVCFNPDFYDRTPVEINGNTVSTTVETLVNYAGNVEAGIVFTLNVNRTISEFTIYHRLPNDEIRILDFSAPLISGDVLRISTVPGSKGATLIRSGTTSSILYGISPQSNWTEFMRGENYIRVYAVGAAIPFKIEYITNYGGL